MKYAEYFKSNPNCTYDEFHAATQGSRQNWYNLRHHHKNKHQKTAVKVVAKRAPQKRRNMNHAILEQLMLIIEAKDREKNEVIRSLAMAAFDTKLAA